VTLCIVAKAKVTIDSLEVVCEKSISTKMNDLDLRSEVVYIKVMSTIA